MSLTIHICIHKTVHDLLPRHHLRGCLSAGVKTFYEKEHGVFHGQIPKFAGSHPFSENNNWTTRYDVGSLFVSPYWMNAAVTKREALPTFRSGDAPHNRVFQLSVDSLAENNYRRTKFRHRIKPDHTHSEQSLCVFVYRCVCVLVYVCLQEPTHVNEIWKIHIQVHMHTSDRKATASDCYF